MTHYDGIAITPNYCTRCGKSYIGLHICAPGSTANRVELTEQPPHFCPVCGNQCGATKPRADREPRVRPTCLDPRCDRVDPHWPTEHAEDSP